MVHIKRAMEQQVMPFFTELKQHFGADQFSFAPQIDIDHKPVGVSFKIGDGAPTTITTAFGNIVVARLGASGSSKGVLFVYPPDAEPYISNSGDLTREKIAKLVELDRQLRRIEGHLRPMARGFRWRDRRHAPGSREVGKSAIGVERARACGRSCPEHFHLFAPRVCGDLADKGDAHGSGVAIDLR